MARMLPDRWCVIVRRTVEFVQRVWSAPVRHDLAMAPNLADIPADGGIREVLQAQDLWWMADFDEAVAAGMAVRVPWDRSRSTPPVVTELLVFGVRADDSEAVRELRELLDAHRFTEGLEFVPQGTPTNNTDTASAGFTRTPADLEAYFDRQVPHVAVRRPPLASASVLGVAAAAHASSFALGLDAANAFDHTEHAGLRTGSWARDMNRSLWPATFGHYLRHMLTTDGEPPLADDDLQWLRDWFRDWVRGPGFLPAFRIGGQPYGLLPVARQPQFGDDLTSSPVDQLRGVLRDLDDWQSALGNVAHFSGLSAELTGAPPLTPQEEAAHLAAVLGAVPHPTAFRLREAPDMRDEITAAWEDQIAEMERLLGQSADVLSALYDGTTFEDRLDIPIKQGTITEQSLALARLRDHADSLIGGTSEDASIIAVRDHIDQVVRPLTAAHAIRSETRAWDERFSGATLPSADDPALWYIEYGDDGAAPDGSFPRLALIPSGAAGAVASLLRRYAGDARAATGIPRPGYIPGTPAALLEKLIQHAVQTVPARETEELARGLEGLAGMLDGGAVADPLAELRRLLRETLGLATHRYDAWVSSVANARLAELRTKRPTGLQVGGYGWLVNLVPDEDGGADTEGFLHAPSLDHAATAAVLRSAWLAHASDAQDAPFAVDLSSDRVRRAMWLLDGVRNGVDLADLLGARFERRLHDHGLSHLIADVREQVLEATGEGGRPPNAIVDGLALAVAYSESTTDDTVFATLEQWRGTLGEEGGALLTQLRESVADLDATSDLLTAQSVHSVTKGNLAEAASTLSVAGAGEAGVPQLRMPSVHRESRLVNHRVVAVLTTPDPPRAPLSLLGRAEPALAAWLEAVLPELDEVPVTAAVGDGGVDGRWAATLAGAGLTAIDVVTLAGVGGELETARLGALLAARARFETGAGGDSAVTFVAAGTGPDALADLAIVAGALRSAIGAARPLRGHDLADTELDHEVDVAELETRRLGLATALEDLAALPPGPSLLTDRLADLAAVDADLAIAALSSAADRDRHLADLLERAAAAAAALREPLPADYPTRAPQAKVDYLAERIRGALAVDLPILPRTALVNSEELAAGFAATRSRVGSPVQALSWLVEVGRVHPGAGRCGDALDLLESIHLQAPIPLQIAQVPDLPDEPWVAVDAPLGDGGRLHVVSVTDAAAALARGPVSGLLFDAWSEPIPGRGATTGLAVHFDRPGAQPPQAVLLTVPPTKGPWTVEEIETILVQTLELAQMRAVGPETLQRLGHTLPAVYLDDGVAVDVEAQA
jgi:hypothetical protein